jgi:hypothetical protein
MQQPPYDPLQRPQFEAPPFNPGPPRPQSWLSRHTGLAIGIGCFGLVLLACLFIGGIFTFISTMMRSSDPYKVALSAAAHDPVVVAALGTPIEAGWFTSGQINVSGPTGHANLSIPISGPRGSATVAVVADKAAGTWTYRTLAVAVEGRAAAVDLLPALPATPSP